jgi:hypothetical protein
MALMQMRSRLVAVLIVSPLSLVAQTAQTLDATGAVGKYTSIAVDATNSPHISYYDATNRDLKSVWKSGIWYAGPVQQTGNVGEYTSIAVTSTPILTFISYYDGGNDRLNLAHQETAGATAPYTSEQLPVSVRLLARSSLALNLPSVTPIIAFFDVNDRTLKLALFDRGGTFSSPPLSYPKWGVEAVATAPTNVEDLALVLDAGSNPHIAYIEQSGITAVLKYAHKTCAAAGCLSQISTMQQTGVGPWSNETVTGTGPVGTSVALALDPATRSPLIAFYSGGQLKYATKSGTSWSVETVDASADVGKYVSIALATNGDPNLVYYDATNGDLKRAVKSAGTWTVTTLDGAGADVGQYTSAAIGPDNILRVSYYDVTNADLKYWGPAQYRRDCGGACGPMIGGLVIPLVIAAFWRRRVAHERM